MCAHSVAGDVDLSDSDCKRIVMRVARVVVFELPVRWYELCACVRSERLDAGIANAVYDLDSPVVRSEGPREGRCVTRCAQKLSFWMWRNWSSVLLIRLVSALMVQGCVGPSHGECLYQISTAPTEPRLDSFEGRIL
jgi:hypothetical protein